MILLIRGFNRAALRRPKWFGDLPHQPGNGLFFYERLIMRKSRERLEFELPEPKRRGERELDTFSEPELQNNESAQTVANDANYAPVIDMSGWQSSTYDMEPDLGFQTSSRKRDELPTGVIIFTSEDQGTEPSIIARMDEVIQHINRPGRRISVLSGEPSFVMPYYFSDPARPNVKCRFQFDQNGQEVVPSADRGNEALTKINRAYLDAGGYELDPVVEPEPVPDTKGFKALRELLTKKVGKKLVGQIEQEYLKQINQMMRDTLTW